MDTMTTDLSPQSTSFTNLDSQGTHCPLMLSTLAVTALADNKRRKEREPGTQKRRLTVGVTELSELRGKKEQ